jgi:tRNA-modifying protein YgfZ
MFSELRGTALIAVGGSDAAAFLHAQLTSEIAGLPLMRTQYSGYCSPKGRLLATFVAWRTDDGILLELPAALREPIQARLSKYVLRAQVKLTDATPDYRVFGVWGSDAPAALRRITQTIPEALNEIATSDGAFVTRLSLERFMALVPAPRADAARAALALHAREQPERVWTRLEIENGIPVIVPQTQERFVPQMVNLDLIGGVSYTKGCYPGQEIVARTHYLGRLKQRMYRMHVPSAVAPVAGDALYSEAFGAEQASGTILNAAPAETGYEALAVIQTSAVAAMLHWKSPDGPAVELKRLPYSVPE